MTAVTSPAMVTDMSTPDETLAQLRKDTAAAAKLAERRDALILEARRGGATWRSIADAVGMTELATRKAATRENGGELPSVES